MPASSTMQRWVIDRHDATVCAWTRRPSRALARCASSWRGRAECARPDDDRPRAWGWRSTSPPAHVGHDGLGGGLGEGVGRFRPGDQVIVNLLPEWIDGRPTGAATQPSYLTLGGHYPDVLAGRLCVPEGWLVAAAASLGDSEAATLPVAGLTAWFTLVAGTRPCRRQKLRPVDRGGRAWITCKQVFRALWCCAAGLTYPTRTAGGGWHTAEGG